MPSYTRRSFETLALTARSAATTNGTAVSCKEFGKASLIVRSGTETGSPSGRTLDVKLQGSLDDSGSVWVDVTGGAITQITTANANAQKYDVTIHGFRRLRIVHVLGFTGGTAPTLETQVALSLYQ